MLKKILTLSITGISVMGILLAGCSSSGGTADTAQTVEAKRGDLNITVNSDGNLEMPNQYDLKFGTTGSVDQIFVKEGDMVRQGALLATLDCSSQINSMKSALLNIQTAKNNISFGCDTDHLPYNYPNLAVPRLMEEAESDINKAYSYLAAGDYKEAGYWLVMTYFDIQVCEDMVKTRPNAAELAGAKDNSLWSPDTEGGSLAGISPDRKEVADYLNRYRQGLIDISNYMKAGDYDTALPALVSAKEQMLEVSSKANSTVAIKNRMTFYYADTMTSADFLQTALRYVQDLKDYIGESDATAVDAAKKTYTAKLNLLVGLDVLQNQKCIFESGGSIGWKTLQQFNLSLQGAEIALYTAKLNIMKTAIIAPSDGMAVSVDLKKSYVLSAQDYSSTTAVSLVDINTVRFKGTVDEIDIVKIKTGQKAKISVDALSNQTFTGTVRFISPYGSKAGNVVKFSVLVDLDPSKAEMRGGLSATAEIQVDSVSGAILVPVSSVSTVNGKSYVTMADTRESREVTVGLQNLNYAEIKSGLKEGDKVLMSSNIKTIGSGSGATRTTNPMRVLR